MEREEKERLIELVKNQECLYNPGHNDYKNIKLKQKIWEKIGKALQVDAVKAKETWRVLRDGYVRHQRQKVTTLRGSKRKYMYFTWSSHLTFLDKDLELKRKKAFEKSTLKRSESTESEQSTFSMEQSFSPHPETTIKESPSPLWTNEESSSQIPNSVVISLDPIQTTEEAQNMANTQEITNKLIEYLQNSNANDRYDDVDHLFASYAKTFKRLSLKNQTELKIDLAKVFADAELRDDLYRNPLNYETQNGSL